MPYKSSLSEEEWKILEPLLPKLLPPKKQTRPSNWSKREILDGIFYQVKNGCNWQDLPKDLPPYSTVYWHLHSVARSWGNRKTNERPTWASAGTSEKKAKWTRWMIIDSQAVKNTCNASVKSQGFCANIATNGINRHEDSGYFGVSFL